MSVKGGTMKSKLMVLTSNKGYYIGQLKATIKFETESGLPFIEIEPKLKKPAYKYYQTYEAAYLMLEIVGITFEVETRSQFDERLVEWSNQFKVENQKSPE